VFSESNGQRGVAIQAGTLRKSAYLKIDQLARLRALIVLAKQTLDGTAPAAAIPQPKPTPQKPAPTIVQSPAATR
jgi:hypothetical protein